MLELRVQKGLASLDNNGGAASQSDWQEFAGVAEHNEVASTDLYMYRLTHKPSRNIQFKLSITNTTWLPDRAKR